MAKLRGRKKLMIETLKKRFGFVSRACQELRISRQTHYDWLKSDLTYKQEFDMLFEELLDLAEMKLFELVGKGDFKAIKFFLSAKGKSRGYSEKQEFEDREQTKIIIERAD